MNKKQKKVFTRIIVAAVLMVVLSLLPIDGWLKFVLFMIPYLVIGHDILLKAWKGILNRQVFDENFLMAVATIGAILLGDYKEGVAVMLFYQIGELFQSYAVGKSRRNISELMDIRPDYANIEKEDGTLEQVDPDEVEKAVYRASDFLAEESGTDIEMPEECAKKIASGCGGDVRKAMNAVELSVIATDEIDGKKVVRLETVEQLVQKSAVRYDREGDEH